MFANSNSKKHLVKLLALLGLIIILIMGVGLWWYLEQRQASEISKDELRYQQSVDQAQAHKSQRQYDQAIVALEDYIKDGRSDTNKSRNYARIGGMYELKRDNKSALESYRIAENLGGGNDLGTLKGIARTSLALGDESTAIIYYEKTIALYESLNKDAAQIEVDYLRELIKDLQETQ